MRDECLFDKRKLFQAHIVKKEWGLIWNIAVDCLVGNKGTKGVSGVKARCNGNVCATFLHCFGPRNIGRGEYSRVRKGLYVERKNGLRDMFVRGEVPGGVWNEFS
jgi:hypothetical protein